MNIVHSSALFSQLSLALVLSRSGACALPAASTLLFTLIASAVFLLDVI